MVTLSLLQQQSASERLKGVTSSSQIEQPGSEVVSALIETLRHDSNVNVRLASVDALRRFGGREAVRRDVVEALPQQESPLVQIALIDFLLEAQGPEAAGVLRRLADDMMLDKAVRDRARRAGCGRWGCERAAARVAAAAGDGGRAVCDGGLRGRCGAGADA